MEPVWEARGGLLKLSLQDVQTRWGEEVARDVVRCAVELDRHDASRRLGAELPWHNSEGRELQPGEVITLLALEVAFCRNAALEEPQVAGFSATSSSSDFLAEVGSRSPSPAWSVLDSVLQELGLEASGSHIQPLAELMGSELQPPALEATDAVERCDLSDREAVDLYDWSVADPDLEALLREPVCKREGGHLQLMSQSGPGQARRCNEAETLRRYPYAADVREAEALLGLLDEEVSDSFRFLNAVPSRSPLLLSSGLSSSGSS